MQRQGRTDLAHVANQRAATLQLHCRVQRHRDTAIGRQRLHGACTTIIQKPTSHLQLVDAAHAGVATHNEAWTFSAATSMTQL